ncbi:hypothetical protein D3C80_1073920 [compost metagenome]
MRNNTVNTDLILKIIGSILTAAGIIIGLWQFTEGQKQNVKIEFERRMWEKKLNTYDELAKVTGDILIHAKDTLVFDSLFLEFDRLYYTKMVLAESDSVEKLMIRTRDELKNFRKGESDINRLKNRVNYLMDGCKNSLKEDWKDLE